MISNLEQEERMSKIVEFYKSKPAYQFKIKELTNMQRQHLAYRLDYKTSCGMITAACICEMKGEYGEKTLEEIFGFFLETKSSIKSHSYKVIQFDNFGTMILNPNL